MLEEINKQFCNDSKRIIFEIGPNSWSKATPDDFSVKKYGVARSIESTNRKEVLFVMDIDLSFDIKRTVWKYLQKRINELDIMPLIKFSGRKGFHIIYNFVFPINIMPESYLFMREYAYYLWKHWDLNTIGIKFGRFSSKETSFVDANLFHNNALIRGFCTRFNGQYSVPIDINDDYDVIIKKSKLEENLSFEGIPSLYIDKSVFDDFVNKIGSKPYKSENYHIKIDEKNILDSPDPSHRERWELVVSLKEKGMTEKEILDYIVNNNKWDDFNYYKTAYQVHWTFSWAERAICKK